MQSLLSWLILRHLSQTGVVNVERVYFTHGYKKCGKSLPSLALAMRAPPMHNQWMMTIIRPGRRSAVAEVVVEAVEDEVDMAPRGRERGCSKKKSLFHRHIHRMGLHLLSSL